jgi:hypothetical protein
VSYPSIFLIINHPASALGASEGQLINGQPSKISDLSNIRTKPAIFISVIILSSVKELAGKILAMFREAADKSETVEISTAAVYKTFLNEAPHDMVQRSIQYLLDRDFIAPHSYSLTAKGRMKEIETKSEPQS